MEHLKDNYIYKFTPSGIIDLEFMNTADNYNTVKVLVVDGDFMFVGTDGVPMLTHTFIECLRRDIADKGLNVRLFFDPSTPKYQACIQRNADIVALDGNIFNNIGISFSPNKNIDADWFKSVVNYIYKNYTVTPADWSERKTFINGPEGAEHEAPPLIKQFRKDFPTVNATYYRTAVALYPGDNSYGFNIIVF